MDLIFTPEPEISHARKKAIEIDKRRLDAIGQLKNAAEQAFMDFWYPVNSVTPQDMADQFGVNCAKVFAEHAATITFLLTQGVTLEPSKYTPPRHFTVNPDGTVTIEDVIEN